MADDHLPPVARSSQPVHYLPPLELRPRQHGKARHREHLTGIGETFTDDPALVTCETCSERLPRLEGGA